MKTAEMVKNLCERIDALEKIVDAQKVELEELHARFAAALLASSGDNDGYIFRIKSEQWDHLPVVQPPPGTGIVRAPFTMPPADAEVYTYPTVTHTGTVTLPSDNGTTHIWIGDEGPGDE